MGRSGVVPKRVSLSIPEDVQEAPRHPDYLGLPRGTSQSKVLENLLLIGWRTVKRQRAEAQELALYAAYEKDPERVAASTSIQRMTLRSGVV